MKGAPTSRGLQPAPALDRYPVAWEQLAVLQAETAAEMGTAYNLPSGLELPEDVDMDRLRAAVDALIERHEILRTRFIPASTDGGEPTMEILPPGPAVFEEIELPPESGFVEALNPSVRPFDLWSGVPMRITLGRVNGKPRVLVLDVHHALADAFSMELLLADLAALYAGAAGPPPTIHLKDYAWWSRSGRRIRRARGGARLLARTLPGAVADARSPRRPAATGAPHLAGGYGRVHHRAGDPQPAARLRGGKANDAVRRGDGRLGIAAGPLRPHRGSGYRGRRRFARGRGDDGDDRHAGLAAAAAAGGTRR